MALTEKQSLHVPPTWEALIKAAQDLVPRLSERAASTEDLQCLPVETISDLKEAGIHKIFTPKQFGGFEMDWGTHVDVSRVLGRACGSTAWIASVVMSHTWMLGRFPLEAQTEIWGKNPDAIIATAFAGGGTVRPVDEGFTLNGTWHFSSGIDHADCVIVGAVDGNFDPAKQERPQFRLSILLPEEYEIDHSSWQAEGLKGTGSKSLRVENKFIPASRSLLSEEVQGFKPPGAHIHESYIYGVEFAPYFTTLLIGPILGMAEGAQDAYVAETTKRRGQMFGESIAEQSHVQVRLGESQTELHMAQLLTENILNYLHEVGCDGRRPVGKTRLMVSRDLAMAAKLARQATARLANMMGVSAQAGRNSVQRHYRDLRTATSHGALQWEKCMAPWGKMAFGLPTGDPFVDSDENNQ